MSENVEHIEVTTQIGCPVQCARFCPQEVTAAKYFSDSGNAPYAKLSLENFRIMLATVPKSVQIVFSGFCEPFANPECIDLIEYAHNEGYTMRLYTTLYGATTSDVQRLIKIPFTIFDLHLCDGENTKIPLTDTYKDNVFTVLNTVPNLTFVQMNNSFKSNNRENITRNGITKKTKRGYCWKRDVPAMVLLPNGNLQLCCMDFALNYKIGNLLTESYADVRTRYLKNRNKFELCNADCKIKISKLESVIHTLIASYMNKRF